MNDEGEREDTIDSSLCVECDGETGCDCESSESTSTEVHFIPPRVKVS